MPHATTVVAKPAAKTRSAVSNRSRLFAQTDARSAWGRRYRDLVHDIGRDLGGAENLPELKLALVRRAAALVTECEKLEARLAEGEEVDVDLLGRLTGHTRRLAEILGTGRVAKDATPSLADIVASHHAEAAKPAHKAQDAPALVEAPTIPPAAVSPISDSLSEDAGPAE